jgi:ABC-type uncharacterized transport system ATPase subunit
MEQERLREAGQPFMVEQGRGSKSTEPIIVVNQLVKQYKRAGTNAVDAISFTVPPGSLFALLGPNGAGKTTTLSILTTTLTPTSGNVIDPTLTPWMLNCIAQSTQSSSPEDDNLTEREREVERLRREGLNRQAIAQRLSIAPSTVKTHQQHIAEKRSKARDEEDS